MQTGKISLRIWLLLFVLVVVCTDSSAQLSGLYTIDPAKAASSTNYLDFTNAVSDLVAGSRTDGGTANGKGVNGAVVFSVADGTYREQIEIDAITGASVKNTITFQSASKDSTKVNLVYQASISKSGNYTLYLNGARHIIFKQLGISRDSFGVWGTTIFYYGNVIEMAYGADSNSFINNSIKGIQSIYANAFYLQECMLLHDSAEYNLIKGNHIVFGGSAIQGYYGVGNNTIDGNICEDQVQFCISLNNFRNCTIRNNILRNIQYNKSIALRLSADYGYTEITNNRILSDGGTAFYYASSGDSVLVANNFITERGLTATAMQVYGGKKFKVFNNSIYYDPDPALYYFIFVYAGPGSQSLALIMTDVYFKNNILVNTCDSPYAQFMYGSFKESDYNDFYFKGLNLAALQKITKMDAHSVFIDPQFISDIDLHATNPLLKHKGTALGIYNDFDNNARNNVKPDIGADEFITFSNDAQLLAIDSPSAGLCGGNSSFICSVKNAGTDTLKSVKLHYSINGGSVTDYSWTGAIEPGGINSISIGSSSFSAGKTYKLLAYTTDPNGVKDSNTLNDTFRANYAAAMSGDYTVDPLKGDFKTITEAANALHDRGICGTVHVKIADGRYTERVNIKNIAGTSVNDSVFIQSASGDSSKVILDWPLDSTLSEFYTGNYALGIEGVQWITIKQVTISRSGNGYFGKAVRLKDVSNSCFLNNHITGVKVDLQGSYKDQDRDQVAFYCGEGLDTNLLIQNNWIEYGNYSCYFGNHVDTAKSIMVRNNIIDSGMSAGIYFTCVKRSSIIGNTIKDVGKVTYYSIWLELSEDMKEVSYNRIYNSFGGVGIFLYIGKQSQDSMLIYNNILTMSGVSRGITFNFPIALSSYSKAVVCYNSIYVNNPTASGGGNALAFYYGDQLGGKGIHCFNNCLYSDSNSNVLSFINQKKDIKYSDYNNFNARFNSIAVKAWPDHIACDLKKWQSFGTDSHSISVNPLYKDNYNLVPKSIFINDKALYYPKIMTDINGKIRGKHPDMGAVEFRPHNHDLFAVAIASPQEGDKGDSNMSIKAVIGNNGLDSETNFKVNAIVHGKTYSVTYSKYLRSAGYDTVTLAPVYHAWYGDTLAITVYTDLANDSDRTNDTIHNVPVHIIGHAHKPKTKDYWACTAPYNATLAATAINSGEANYWFIDSLTSKSIYIGDSFKVSNLKNDTGLFVRTDMLTIYDTLASNKIKFSTNDAIGADAGLFFDALEDFTLDSVTIYPWGSGRFVLNIFDPMGKRIVKREFYIEVKKPGDPIRIPVRVFFPQATGYYISSDSSCNGGYGFVGGMQYPRTDKLKLVSITGPYATNPAAASYYLRGKFFLNYFNWKIIPGRITYPSEEVKVSAKIDTVKAGISVPGLSACAGTAIVFKDSSSVRKGFKFSSFSMNFGDSTSAFNSLKPVSFNHSYNNANSYDFNYVVTSSSGCKDSVSKNITILQSPGAHYKITWIDLANKKARFGPIDSNTSATYFWDFGDGTHDTSKNPIHSFPANAIYKVALTTGNAGGCSNSFTDSINLIITAAFSLKNSADEINVFPNPVRDNFTLFITVSSRQSINISLYNLQGKLINTLVSSVLEKGNNSFVFSAENLQLSAGAYVLKAVMNGQVINKILILK